MRILITGGFGYIGGRLAQHLAASGRSRIVLASRCGVASPRWLPDAEVFTMRWDDASVLRSGCSGIDAVVHLAGMNAQDCAADPAAALAFNGVATARLLQAAVAQGVRRFVYMSTAHVYASPLVGEITEQDCPQNLHPYASSHRAGEDAVRAAAARGEVGAAVIRLSNAFGAPAHVGANCWMLLVNDLCRQAVSERRMVLRTPGLQSRDFIAMADVCRAVGHLLDLPEQSLGDGLFNVGGQAMSVYGMAKVIRSRCAETLGFMPEIVRPMPAAGESATWLDYRTDKLLASGFAPDGCGDAEIDEVLRMCRAEWGAK